MSGAEPRVQILHVRDCPHVDRVRELVTSVLERTGSRSVVEEIEGDHPSPTLLVDGVDVVTGQSVDQLPACRLDLPTEEQIFAALRVRMIGAPMNKGRTT